MTKATIKTPESFRFKAPTIADLQPGESGYAVPWAFDLATCELRECFSVAPEPSGTVEMLVERAEDGSLSVSLPHSCTWRWERRS